MKGENDELGEAMWVLEKEIWVSEKEKEEEEETGGVGRICLYEYIMNFMYLCNKIYIQIHLRKNLFT